MLLNPAIATEDRIRIIDSTDIFIDKYQFLSFKPRKTVHPFSFVQVSS